jgi:transposase
MIKQFKDQPWILLHHPPMLPVVNPHAAAVDVGSEQMHVSIAGGPPKVFGTCTADVRALVAWLKEQKVSTVAMEATGIYWLCLYEELEATSIPACVVNGAHVKNVPGRKSDMADCQWLSKLHCLGLLRGGYVPEEEVRRLRDYQRLRADHVSQTAMQVQLMHKALERMNIKVHDVLSSLVGVSGLKIVRAIVQGERDAVALAMLCDAQVLKSKKAALIKSLEGRWGAQHLFALRQALEGWDFYQRQIQACDLQLEAGLKELKASSKPSGDSPQGQPPGNASGSSGTSKASGKAHKEMRHNAPQLIQDLHQHLVRIFGGQDLSLIPALSDYTVLQLLGEIGTSVEAWPTHKHFTSWLGLAPGCRQSGKMKARVKRHCGRAGRIFCVAARSLARAKNSWLGAFYRRIRALRGGRVANKAAARKVAELFYHCLSKGMSYVEQGLAQYEENYRQRSANALSKQARLLGLEVIIPPQTTPVTT